MTIREFIGREEKQNIGLADNIKRTLKTTQESRFRDSRIMAAYEIRGMLFALLYSGYITAEEFESLMDDWAVITKDIFRS